MSAAGTTPSRESQTPSGVICGGIDIRRVCLLLDVPVGDRSIIVTPTIAQPIDAIAIGTNGNASRDLST